ncbi:hypothetical protein ACQ4PT_051438 [Festuca glaucescens]
MGLAVEVDTARPACERSIIYRTPEVDDAERALRWGLVTFVSGTRSVSRSAASAAVLERFPALAGRFSVHCFWPADLLFVFDSRASRDALLTTNPLDGRDFTLRFAVWNRQLQATRTLRYRVHLEVVGVLPVAWSMDTAKTILGSSAWVERLGSETANKADMGSFRVTAWTDDPATIPKAKRLWLAKPLLFGDEDDDLLLPVEALIPEEVAMLEYDAAVHLVRVEDTTVSRGWSLPGDATGDESGSDDGGRGHMGEPEQDSVRPHHTAARGSSAAGQTAPSRRWRGGTERRVALGQTTRVQPWPSVQDDAVLADDGGRGLALNSLVVGRILSPHGSDQEQALVDAGGGDIDVNPGWRSAVGNSPVLEVDDDTVEAWDSSRFGSSTSIQGVGLRWWPKASPVLWDREEDALLPTGPLSPVGSVGSVDSDRSVERGQQYAIASMFTVELSLAASPSTAPVDEVEEGEIVETVPVQMAPATRPDLPPITAQGGTPSTDINCGLASFRERCKQREALLPRPAPKKPRKKTYPTVVRRSLRVAGRFAPGTPIKQQQKTLMIQLGIAREGEVIGDAALEAYLRYFKEKPMSAEDLSTGLALFGWLPEVMPLADGGDVDLVV